MWNDLLVIILGVLLFGLLIVNLRDGVADALLFVQRLFGFPRNVKTGTESYIGKTATVICHFELGADTLEGKIRLNGEIWSARSEGPTKFKQGELVRVYRVKGLVAYVEGL